MFALKLYGAPFLIYFAAKRNWKAVAGMAGTILVGGVISIWMFGWHDVSYFLRDILPRAVMEKGPGIRIIRWTGHLRRCCGGFCYWNRS